MPDSKQLPHLIKLLEDESEMVQQAVLKELYAFGPRLELELDRLSKSLTEGQKEKIRHLLQDYHRHILRQAWPAVLKMEGENQKLESALSLLADFQNGPAYPAHVKELLDGLAGEFLSRHPQAAGDPFRLADFLFKEKALRGNEADYYNPANSNLVFVIQNKKGIPISLAAVYLLTGERLKMAIEGCNFPSHFLARVRTAGGRMVWVDCFNGGVVLDEDTILKMTQESPQLINDVLVGQTTAEMILARILSNLIRAYDLTGNSADRELMMDLLKPLVPEEDEGGLEP